MTFHLGAPQLIYLGAWIIGIAYETIHHGEPKTDKRNAWFYLAMCPLYIGLLYWGGFFG